MRGRGSKAYRCTESGVSVSSSKNILARPTFAPTGRQQDRRRGKGREGTGRKRKGGEGKGEARFCLHFVAAGGSVS